MTNPLIIALDLSPESALSLAKSLSPNDCQLKVGHQLFTAAGPNLIRELQELGFKIFLDLKYHDIPNTVFSAVSAAINLDVWMLNVHASGGPEMIKAAVAAKEKSKNTEIKLLGGTILTSLDEAFLQKIGFKTNVLDSVANLAQISKENGLDGIVCSPNEVKYIKSRIGKDFLTVTPGIRPLGSDGDQKRVESIKAALTNGSDYIVIGRPITKTPNPVKSVEKILEEINS